MSDNFNTDKAAIVYGNGGIGIFDDLFRGLEPDRIIHGFKDARIGEPVFVFKWKNSPNLSRITASIANVKYPQHVIKFYEDIILSSVAPKYEDKENHDTSNRK